MKILRKMPIKSSWEDLKNAADNGTLEDVLKSGDQIPATLKDGREILLDVGRDGSGKFYFICHDCIAECTMNRKGTNKGGWRDSDARTFLNTEVLSLFPDDIQAVMRPTKITQVWRDETLETEDRLFLLSRTQVFGEDSCYVEQDSGDSQIDIFRTGHGRAKELDNIGNWYWWLRSPNAGYSTHFCFVYSDGSAYNYDSGCSFGLAPAFCIE